MKLSAPITRFPVPSWKLRPIVYCGTIATSLFLAAALVPAQTAQPQPIVVSTPAASPNVSPSSTPSVTPSPTSGASPSASPASTPSDTPISSPIPTPATTPVPGGTPQITITPGVPSAAEMEAYNTARTPQVAVTLGVATATPGLGGAQDASTTTSVLHPRTEGGVCAAVTLRPASSTPGKVSRTSSATGSNMQPVATVTLTYASSSPGELVWVQMARPAGTLTATDSTGQVYPGDHGFFLTLGAAGQAMFTFQAPDVGGTYQIFTRFDNVTTVVPFLVPDAVP